MWHLLLKALGKRSFLHYLFFLFLLNFFLSAASLMPRTLSPQHCSSRFLAPTVKPVGWMLPSPRLVARTIFPMSICRPSTWTTKRPVFSASTSLLPRRPMLPALLKLPSTSWRLLLTHSLMPILLRLSKFWFSFESSLYLSKHSCSNFNFLCFLRFRNLLKTGVLIASDNPSDLTTDLSVRLLAQGGAGTPNEIDAITAADVKAFASKIAKGKPALATIGRNAPYLSDIIV